jgi:translation initiation factor 4G
MHKAEKKYEVGKVVDEEEAKQRQLRAILNKLTPANFDKLFEQVKAVNIDNAATLTGVVSQIFDRTLMEPIYCEMYVNFCCHLAGELPDFNEDNEKVTFKRVLLNKCQEEFERGERVQEEETNKAGEEGEIKQTAEEREEMRVKARRRMLGNIRLIGELYKKKMLTERIMHACTQKLLGQYQDPDEEDLEALCKLMSTIGEMIDHQKVKENMDAYFDRMKTLSNNMNLSSRVRFMLKDAIDLRKNKWHQRRKVEGPKRIEEVQRDAAQERAQVSRLGRAPSINQSARRVPMEFAPRGSTMLSSPNAQIGSYRGLPTRGYGTLSERTTYGTREDLNPRNIPDRFAAPAAYDQLSPQERNVTLGNRELRNVDRSFDRSLATSSPARGQGAAFPQNVPSEKAWPEERLRDMSMAAIKEFYRYHLVLCTH